MEVWWPPIKVNFTPFINMTLRVFEAFSGVGSQRMALRNLGIAHEVVATSDIDEFAVKSYAAIHDSNKIVPQVTDEEMQDYLEKRNIPLNNQGVRKNLKGKKLIEFYEACIKSNNLGDISKVVTQDIPDHDLFTYSFPCQDISVAGQGLGLDEGSDTRSGLLWECQKIIAGKKPKYLLLENVKNLVGKKHKPNFDKWLEWLEEQGYTNYWQVLNAKEYGIPQNRERVFVVSILGEHEPYKFPEPIELELRLKDVLESEVDEKFYLDDERVNQLNFNWAKAKKGEVSQVGQYDTETRTNSNRFRTYSPDGIGASLTTMGGGGREPCVVEGVDVHPFSKKLEFRGYKQKEVSPCLLATDYKAPKTILESQTNSSHTQKDNLVVGPKIKKIGNIYPSGGQNGNVFETEGISPTISSGSTSTKGNGGIGSNNAPKVLIKNEVVEPLGTLAAHNSDKFGPGYMEGLSKMLKANKHDISVVERVRRLAETNRPNDEIGVTLKANGDIRPHRMDKKKSGIQELNINHEDNSSHTITTNHMPKVYGDTTSYRIRKLTPKECWRLMGFSDEDFHKAEEVNSNSQLYKQAGNSIVVDVLEGIFKQLLEEE